MVCSKCSGSYPMGFAQCPHCGASSQTAVLESELPKEVLEEVKKEGTVNLGAQEPESSDSFFDIPKFSSLEDEEMFLQPFFIPAERPPDDDEEEEFIPKKKSRWSTRKLRKQAALSEVENNVSEEIITTPVVDESENVIPVEDKTPEETKVPKPVFKPLDRSPIFAAAATSIANDLSMADAAQERPTDVSDRKGDTVPADKENAAQRPSEPIVEPVKEPKGEVVKETVKKPVKSTGKKPTKQPVKEAEEKAVEEISVKPITEQVVEPVAEVVKEPSVAPVQSDKKTLEEKPVSATPKKKPSEKKLSSGFPRQLIIASVFGVISIFIPLAFIPSNIFLNKVPKEEKSAPCTIVKGILNVLFFINLICLVFGLVSLTKAVALNYQSLFAGDFIPFTGEFGKVAPLMFVRTGDFWVRFFSPNGGIIQLFFSEHLANLSKDLALLNEGFSFRTLFSIFKRVGGPLITVLAAAGVAVKFWFDGKISSLERKIERTYEMGNFRGEDLRKLKSEKRDLYFRKQSIIRVIVFLFVIGLLMTIGEPIIEKLIPLLDFVKEDIQKTN